MKNGKEGTQQQQDAVRAKVIEVCPELMEMTDGCRVRITTGAFDGKIFTFQKDSLKKMYDEFWTDGDSCGACAFSENEFETLGHPIRLSHVLRAIEKRIPCVMGERWVDMASDGWMFLMFKNSEGQKGFRESAKYDLTKDDLSLQSPETIDFLFKILCE